jgi:hypothetical protein
MLGVLCILGGAVVSVLIAEGIALSGGMRYDPIAPLRFVASGGMYIEARDMRGSGWRYLDWNVLDQDSAATDQYMQDKHLDSFEGRLRPSYLHCDAPGVLPGWSALWDSRNWPHDTPTPQGVYHHSVSEVGVGWPLPAFTMNWGSARRYECSGGKVLGTSVTGSLQVVLWRPIPLGLAADTLFYAAALAGLVGVVKLGVRARRRRRGACVACAYDLRGLVAGSACPECGKA